MSVKHTSHINSFNISLGIHDATRSNDIASLTKILSTNDDVNKTKGDIRNTALHIASSKGHVQAAELLITKGADTHLRNKRGYLPSHLAAIYHHENVLSFLLSIDKSLLDAVDSSGNSLLHIAAWKRHPEVIEFLLRKGINISLKNRDGNTAYHTAVLWNRSYILKILLKASKAHVNEVNRKGQTPLHIASEKEYDECVQCLLLHQANPLMKDSFGKTAVDVASEETKKVYMKYEYYKKIVARCAEGMGPIIAARKYFDESTALHIVASFNDSRTTIHQLVQGGANINAHDAYNHTPLEYALLAGNIHNISALMGLGGNSDNFDEEHGFTPLHMAVQRHDIKLLELLLRHKSNVNAVDNNSETPLLYAVANNELRAVRLLLKHGADITITDRHGNTALHLAVTGNSGPITEVLLNENVDAINDVNQFGHTPLMCAVLGRNVGLTNMLLTYGADFFIKDKNGKSIYALAINTKNGELIKTIESWSLKFQAAKSNQRS